MSIHIIGLADKAVAESPERVQAALHASGLSMPARKVTVNPTPAGQRKQTDVALHTDGRPPPLRPVGQWLGRPADVPQMFLLLPAIYACFQYRALVGPIPSASGRGQRGKHGFTRTNGCIPGHRSAARGRAGDDRPGQDEHPYRRPS
ncbi:magnesium chelatase domain-containing protein [Mesorhizobium sp. L-8-10]|uniref:magnesium chelatase domain-containing protein n=1 Tax=Mesorhizobium sp. L-8-10 TaxID=2744523 RepID=UPI00406C3110